MAESPVAGPRRRGREERSSLRGWSDLPDGPLHTILTCLRSFVDFTAFSAVCRSWRAVALSPPVTSLYPPLILRPTFSDHRRLSGLRLLDPASPSFSSPLSRTFRKLEALHFPYFFHGHLLRFSQDRVVVLNPFSGDELVSPVVSNDPKMRYASVMLTSPPSSPDSTVLLFSYDTLFYWHIRSVDSSGWSSYCPTIKPVGGVRAATVQGKVYVMDCVDNLFVLDLAPELHLRPLAVERMAVSALQCFLVDCGGELLHLMLVRTEKINWSRLEAFRLDFSEDRVRWVKKECLGNWAIFVGHDCRVPGLAVRNPKRWGGRNNCVYVATENRNGDKPWAVIKLGDEINMYDPKSPLYNIKCWHQLSASWVHPGDRGKELVLESLTHSGWCGGERLHLLVALIEFNKPLRFEVFQFNSLGNRASWVKKESLGNWAIFVGYDNQVPGLAVENPERWGGKRNCVHSADVPWTMKELGSDEIYTNEREFKHQLSSAWVRPTSGSRNARVFYYLLPFSAGVDSWQHGSNQIPDCRNQHNTSNCLLLLISEVKMVFFPKL